MNLDKMSVYKAKAIEATTTTDFFSFLGEEGFRLTLVGVKFIEHGKKNRFGNVSTYTFRITPYDGCWRNDVSYLTIGIRRYTEAEFYFRKINGSRVVSQYRGSINEAVLYSLDEEYLPDVDSWKGEIAQLVRSFIFRFSGKVVSLKKSYSPMDLSFRYMA